MCYRHESLRLGAPLGWHHRRVGHGVRVIPAAYVKPYVKRNKTDARNAKAICETVSRANMRFVTIKTVAQQAARGVERSLDLLTRQRTQLMNSVRSLLAEVGIVARPGERGFAELLAVLADEAAEMPEALREALYLIARHIEALSASITVLQARIEAVVRTNPAMRRLMTIPGVGPITAHAVVTAIGDGRHFRCARDFAAWCGLTRRSCHGREVARRQDQPAGRDAVAHAVCTGGEHGHAACAHAR